MNGKSKGITSICSEIGKETIMQFHELIYADEMVGEIIKKEFPNAVFTDASDFIHTDRFEVDIETEESDIQKRFYIYALKNGFAENCFTLQLMIHDAEKQKEVLGWLKEYKKETDGRVASGSKLS